MDFSFIKLVGDFSPGTIDCIENISCLFKVNFLCVAYKEKSWFLSW